MHMTDTASVLRSLHSENTRETQSLLSAPEERSAGIQGLAQGVYPGLLCPGLATGFPLGSRLHCQAVVNDEAAPTFHIKKSCSLHKEIIRLSTNITTYTLVTGVASSRLLPGWQAEVVARRACG